MDTYSDAFTYLNLLFGLLYLIFYIIDKKTYYQQDLVYFWTSTIIAVALKGVTILYRIYEQTSANIFFIDWEQPKGYVQREGSASVQKHPPSAFRHMRVSEQWNRISVCIHYSSS